MRGRIYMNHTDVETINSYLLVKYCLLLDVNEDKHGFTNQHGKEL